MERADCVVIGAGIIGLACARALAQAGRGVLILEAASRFGAGISSRSSEVVHAGLYYPPASLKTRLCVEGRERLYDYCRRRHIPHHRCGKLLAACSPPQHDALAAIAAQARDNGIDDLRLLSAAEARRLEPPLRCHSACLSPSTGIVDSHALMLSLLGDAERDGAVLAREATVIAGECRNNGHRLTIRETRGGAQHSLLAAVVVNAAGLDAIALARRFHGLSPAHIPPAWLAKGSYFALSGKAPFSRLIYPLPQTGGLGIHLTLALDGSARFGPDVEWLPGEFPVSGKNTALPSTCDYRVNPQRQSAFADAVRRYWPSLPVERLQPAYAGIRPKLHGPDRAFADFRIDGATTHGVTGLINLFGIESPGLTASLAIAERVAAGLINEK